ncbi:MAG: DNA repair protein RecN [Treponema sp.]|nr:DNA repair protein RecN [Treponema sp.]
MIEDIFIKDFALIDSVNLDFNKGFTVFSGETGAGKSILIGALSFLLGGKASLDQIRTGSSEARVSGTVYIDEKQKEALKWLEERSILVEDNRVLLRRIVRNTGKTAAWIADTPVTRNELSEFTSFFVDIHGQHEHQSLLKISEHRRFLDSFAGLTEIVETFSKNYSDLVKKRNELEELINADADKNKKIDLLSFAVEEITNANLKTGEDISLEIEEKRLSQFEKLYSEIDTISLIINGSENVSSDGVFSALKKLRSLSDNVAGMDSSLQKIATRIENVFYEISDINDEISMYQQNLVFDPARLEEVQKRSHLIYKLKQKYLTKENSVQALLEYAENAQRHLDILTRSAESRAELQAEITSMEKSLYRVASEISQKRKIASEKLSQQVEIILQKLGMKGTKFSVSIQMKEGDNEWQRCGQYGFDNIEFLISANIGSPEKPLAKIASGGELSRVMLALKTVLASSDNVDTLIFDEIDTGIGGEVAVSVGEHLKQLAKNKQILCITHLASIAVFADNQLKIEKFTKDGKTQTSVEYIFDNKRVEEIARMLSGDMDSSFSIEHARALLQNFGGA